MFMARGGKKRNACYLSIYLIAFKLASPFFPMYLSSCENTFSQKATASYVLRLCAFPLSLSLSNHIEEDLFIRGIL